ncbi:hypothetical protein GCM10010916_42000 [Paenibacillus abyssi]|uniref:Uncharacterized protein n=1 Tax=Paenibacillus abyssi TaxID=1340531 RepID=A0A917G3J3_9BACL|nr:hypothetical protein GCM10010916_42000 [Paenibacillus abyssi]
MSATKASEILPVKIDTTIENPIIDAVLIKSDIEYCRTATLAGCSGTFDLMPTAILFEMASIINFHQPLF